MPDLFNDLYFNNTLFDWLVTLILIVLSIFASRLIFLLGRRLTRSSMLFRGETGTNLFVSSMERPFFLAFSLVGIRLSLNVLTISETVTHFIDNLFEFLLTLAITWFILRIYDGFHRTYLLAWAKSTETDFDDQLLAMLRYGVRFVVIALGIVIGLSNAGYDVATLIAGLGIGGLAIALAAQHWVENILGGVNIFVDRHITIGSRIQLKGARGLIDGVVTEIGLRTTKVKTRYEGRIVSIPNAVIANQDVVNVDTEEGRQMFAVYKLSPKMSYQKVQLALKLLKEIAGAHENTKELVITGLIQVSDISHDLMLLYWIDPEASNLKTRTAINLEIIRQFEENDIEFTEKSGFEYQRDTLF